MDSIKDSNEFYQALKQDAKAFVLAYLKVFKVVISNRNEILSIAKPGQWDLSHVRKDLVQTFLSRLAIIEQENLRLKKSERLLVSSRIFNEASLNNALDLCLKDIKDASIINLQKNLKCDKEDLCELGKFLKALTHREDKADHFVMAHWIWQIKRNLYGLPVVDHIFPILYSQKQRMGKSRAIEALTAPLHDFKIDVTLRQLSDERSEEAVANSYVCFVDEMAKAERACMTTLKRLITASVVDNRPMRSNQLIRSKQRCSFIGASNDHIYLLIKDTGMRRYWEVILLAPADFEGLSKIDFLALWKGIDENREYGYQPLAFEDIKEKQELLSTPDSFQLFLDENGWQAPISKGLVEHIPTDEAYSFYKHFCEDNGYIPYAHHTFRKRLESEGIERIRKMSTNIRSYYYQIKPINAQKSKLRQIVN